MERKRIGLAAVILVLLVMGQASISLAESPNSMIQEISCQEFQDNPAGVLTETKELGAAGGWLDSGVKLNNGDLVYIKADGLWMPGWPHPNYGPEGTSKSMRQIVFSLDCPFASLIGRIGENKPFCIGREKAFLVTGEGSLRYSINEIPETLKDNEGSIAVAIQVKREGLAVSSVSSAGDAKKVPLAVFDFHVLNLSAQEAQVLNLILRSQLAPSTGYKVFERNDFERMVRKQGLSRMDVTDPGLAVRIGKSAGAKKVLLGEAGKLGETYTMTLSLMDVETRQVEKTVSKTAQCEIDDLAKFISELVGQLGLGKNE